MTSLYSVQTWPNPFFLPEASVSATMTIDAASEEAAMLFRAVLTGNISKLHFVTAAVTTGATVTVVLKDVSAGNPNAVVASETQVIANADDNKKFSVTLDPVGAVTLGSYYALSVINPAASFGNIQIASGLQGNGQANMGFPYADLFAGAGPAWAKQLRWMFAAVEYDTGLIQQVGFGLIKNTSTLAFNSGSNPNEYGNRFIAPAAWRANGLWLNPIALPLGDFTILLSDSAGTVVASALVNYQAFKDATGPSWFAFDVPYDLTAGATYYMGVRAEAAGNVSLLNFVVEANADLATVDGGANCYRYTRQWVAGVPGAFTLSDVNRVSLGLLYTDVAAGGSIICLNE